jgi:hypothetical protein
MYTSEFKDINVILCEERDVNYYLEETKKYLTPPRERHITLEEYIEYIEYPEFYTPINLGYLQTLMSENGILFSELVFKNNIPFLRIHDNRFIDIGKNINTREADYLFWNFSYMFIKQSILYYHTPERHPQYWNYTIYFKYLQTIIRYCFIHRKQLIIVTSHLKTISMISGICIEKNIKEHLWISKWRHPLHG